MIKPDQPICFPRGVVVAVSSKADKTMLDRTADFHKSEIVDNRRRFCALTGVDYDNCVYQLVSYGEDESYDKISEVRASDAASHKNSVHGDGLFTSQKGVGLFLPVADCVATVVYDPIKQYLALLHLGRHASYADLSTCAVKYFESKGSRAKDLIVWMSPSAGPDSYLLEWFDKQNDPTWQGFYKEHKKGFCLDLAGYNSERLQTVGVTRGNIHRSSIDTMANDNYFSHAAGDTTGRIAVVAMMT